MNLGTMAGNNPGAAREKVSSQLLKDLCELKAMAQSLQSYTMERLSPILLPQLMDEKRGEMPGTPVAQWPELFAAMREQVRYVYDALQETRRLIDNVEV